MRINPFYLNLLLSALVAASVYGQSYSPEEAGNVDLKLEVDQRVIKPGTTARLVVTMKHGPGWNTYWINPGTGFATTLDWTLPEGFSTGEIVWPLPKLKDSGDQGTSHVYKDTVSLIVPLTVAQGTAVGDYQIDLAGNWLECDKNGCLPKGGGASLKLVVGETADTNVAVTKVADQVVKSQPQPLDAWQVTVGGNSQTFELRLTPGEGANSKPGEIYFYESAATSAALKYKMPKVKKDGADLVLTMAKSEAVDSNEIPGFVYAPNGWLASGEKVKALLVKQPKPAAVANEVGADEVVANPFAVSGTNSDEVNAAKQLYDVESKPDFVLANGKKDRKLTLLPALGLVFIGGLLLNLMPCVFPVLGIKIMGFVQQAGEESHKVKNHGLIFGLGVVVSMWVLAAIIIALDLNWGAQLANPAFVAGIVILLFVMGLNMAGVFEMGSSMTNVGSDLQRKKGYSGSFFSGVLTTLIASPCSGPFLGSVMSYALSQKAPIAFIIFTFFALGIASPYIILSFFPAAISKLPKPGAWMEVFKKAMSFALFATSIFFLGAFAKQTGYDGVIWMLFALVVIALALWIYGNWATPYQPKKKRYVIGYGLAGIVAITGFIMVQSAVKKEAPDLATHGEWKSWFPGVMEQSRSKKRVAWVDYTANW